MAVERIEGQFYKADFALDGKPDEDMVAATARVIPPFDPSEAFFDTYVGGLTQVEHVVSTRNATVLTFTAHEHHEPNHQYHTYEGRVAAARAAVKNVVDALNQIDDPNNTSWLEDK
jgi:hypothetical protein